MASIFDDLAAQYPGLQLPPQPGVADTQRLPQVPPRQLGWGQPPPPPQPQWRPPSPPPGCARCAERDRPYVLIHRHLNDLHHQIRELEHLMSQALDNANAQIANLTSVVTTVAIPLLQQLGALVAQGGTGVPEADVQAVADSISTVTSQLASAAQAAQAQIPTS